MKNRKKLTVAVLMTAFVIGLFSIPRVRSATGLYDATVRIVDSTGNVMNGVASAMTGLADMTVRVVDSSGHVIDSLSPSVTVSLSSAQIKALDLTPITLVAAQGANKVIIPTAILIQGKFGTRAYVSLDAALDFDYTSIGTGNLIGSYVDSSANAIFTAASSLSSYSIPGSINSGWTWAGNAFAAPAAASVLANAPLIVGVNPAVTTYNAGPILTMTVANGGAGYANGDAFTIDASQFMLDTGDATGHVVSSSGGVVQTVAIDAGGTSYAVTTANALTGPYATAHTSGSGNNALTVRVATATVGDGTGSITVFYNVATLQ